LMGANDDPDPRSADAAASSTRPEVSRGDRLDQFRRQIAALFEVAPDQVEIIVRT
jgi:hypothetical protein